MGKKSQQKKGQAIWLVTGVAVLAVAVLVTLSILSSQQQSPGKEPGTEPPVTEPPAASVASDKELGAVPRMMGPDGAKVTVVEYMNYL